MIAGPLKSGSLWLTAMLIGGMLAGCAGGERKAKKAALSSSGDSAINDMVDRKSTRDSDDDEVGGSVASASRSFDYSLSNNKLTSRTVKRAKALSWGRKLEPGLRKAGFKDRRKMEGWLIAEALGGAGSSEVQGIGRRLAGLEMRKNISRSVSEEARLGIVISAVHNRNFSLAEHFLIDLTRSKKAQVRAAAFTLEGIIAQKDGRLPEAVQAWKDALKARSNYRPALLNIGFSALKYGDYRTARKMLGSMQNDWFALYGLVIAERLAGKSARADSICNRLRAQKPTYKPGLYSCALNQYHGKGNLEKARTMLKALTKVKSGPSVIDELAYRTIAALDKDLRKRRSKKPVAKGKGTSRVKKAKNKAKDVKKKAPKALPVKK